MADVDYRESIGGLWLKESHKGTKFMSGEIEINGVKHSVVVFKNDKGDNERRPDYRIYPSRPKSETGANNPSAPPKQDFEDQIPF